MAKFAYLPLASEFLAPDSQEKIINRFRSVLANGGGALCTPAGASTADQITFFIITGGTEQITLEAAGRLLDIDSGDPLILITHPGNNSLPAALELLARWRQDGRRGRIIHFKSADDTEAADDLQKIMTGWEVRRELLKTRIGLVGQPSDWLVASSPAPAVVAQTWGPTIVPIEMADITIMLKQFDQDKVVDLAGQFIGPATAVGEPDEAAVQAAVKVYLALKKIVDRENLAALSVRCFDLVTDKNTTGCLALAQLNDEGIVAGCEGDLNSTIAMLWVKLLLGQDAWMANPATIDAGTNSLKLAHCTVGRNLVKGYQLRSHFESGLGVGIQGELPPGPVTLARIGGRKLDEIWVADGEITDNGESEELCRTQVDVELNHQFFVTDLLEQPLGNHLVLTRGHHAGKFQDWFETFI